ncbi:phosphate/phosphite/phosphonate ABC transporter substrate-binding protein [Klebsiella sp. WOUb02]|uniref:phosphate/phosphite/phosphonate ABC transporter substrate-binding protein n=1 Tax=Klebsiella sp. WOUb02 TaxID=3161071 RepID=UPI003CF491D1
MSNVIDFPMYAVNHEETRALWRALREILAARGVAVDDLPTRWPREELLSHWDDPQLLLSQTCGYPLVTRLPEVQIVGCFHYAAAGCEGANYRSLLVSQAANQHRTLADFRQRRAVCNSPDSQSGYNALRKMVAPLAESGRFFSAVRWSGSHRQSLIELQQGTADIAAIDCVSWALLQRHEPALLTGLSVIGRSPLAPGLPLISGKDTPPATIAILREGLHQLVSGAQYRDICEAQLIADFSVVTRRPYAQLLAWRDEAAASGVARL